jgi:2,4-dienoyl-CoA reductase-like NADH-dependent reductase (Old Yellow Enzyme family)
VTHLFDPLTLRDTTFRNRIFVSPMCQYSSTDGMPNDWHLVHLGSRAVGGAGLVMVEATAISPEGRITPADSGLWSAAQADGFRRIVDFVRRQGAAAGIQLAHAGRKASTRPPWEGGSPLGAAGGAWETVAPSAVPFGRHPPPRALTEEEIDGVVADFEASARLALDAGFDVVELHMAHGYLLHEFLSPLANRREDRWGGSFENRSRLPLMVAEAVRRIWPAGRPLFARISATDWAEGGWTGEDSVRFARELARVGVDLVDCSTGGIVPGIKIPAEPGYQVPFSARVRIEAGIATAAVGLITEPAQAQAIVSSGEADAVMLARAMLRDPYWPLHAARELGVDVKWPDPYLRARD